MKASTHKHS